MLKKIFLCIIFIITYIFFGIITWGEHIYMLMLSLLSSFFISYFVILKSKNSKGDLILLNLPFSLLLLLTCVIGNDFSRGLLYIIFTPVSSLLAYYFYIKKNRLIPFFSILLFLFISFYLQPNYFSYYQNRNSKKNIVCPRVTLLDKNKKLVPLKQNKIIVLDFWSTNCGICLKKFPDLEDTYLKYKKNPSVEIYAVNVPIGKGNFDKNIKILDSIGYTFSKLYSNSAKEIKDSLNIYSFPHLLIIKNGKIRFDGTLETNENVFIYNLNNKIEQLINEP